MDGVCFFCAFTRVNLSACLLAELCKNHSTDVHLIWWRGVAWAKKNPLNFVADPLAMVEIGILLYICMAETCTVQSVSLVLEVSVCISV